MMLNNPITAASIKKIFKEYFAPELINHGFIRKQEIWVRKVGEIFQVFGTDSVCVRMFISPYWINNTERPFNHIDYSRKKSYRLSMCGNINFPLEISPFFAPEKSFDYFNERYLSKLDRICDINSYIEFCQKEYEPIYVSDYALLYDGYLRGSLDFARAYINNAFQKIYDEKFKNAKREWTRTFEIIKSGNFLIWDADNPPDHATHMKYFGRCIRKPWYESYLRGEDISVLADQEAQQGMVRTREVNFPLVQKALATENYDYSDVLEYKEKNGAIMRELIKAEYELEF